MITNEDIFECHLGKCFVCKKLIIAGDKVYGLAIGMVRSVGGTSVHSFSLDPEQVWINDKHLYRIIHMHEKCVEDVAGEEFMFENRRRRKSDKK